MGTSNTSKTGPPVCLLACLLACFLASPPNPRGRSCFPAPPMDDGLNVCACVVFPLDGAPRCCACIKVRRGKTQPACLLACLPVTHPRGRRREDSIINRKGPTANKQGPAVPCVPPPPNRIAVYFPYRTYLVKIQISLDNFYLPTSLVPFVRRPRVIHPTRLYIHHKHKHLE
ncbi:hypothetical protein LX32DRAFT_99105 [Colletotrichum zoysiae]|uniref:Secreted protein n=1 Tax=Colletotrichum zoysiae TaxID=1216348 RepID=A0AAD9HAN6_9PEZI|nr:hypothetical protein LX32DRAFT_99105 [Colletotrichum zoysiae]